MNWSKRVGVKCTVRVLTATIFMYTVLLISIETDIFETRKEIKEMVPSDMQHYVTMGTNWTMKRRMVGSGRLLTTDLLKNITKGNETHCSRHRYLVYKCDASSLCGGWGDREKGIVSSFALALLTNRKLIIQMSDPCEIRQLLQHNVYNWHGCNNFLSKIRKDERTEFNYVDSREFIKRIPDFDFDSNWKTQVVVLRINTYLFDSIRLHKHAKTRLSWLLKTTNEEAIHLILHTLFKPNQRIQKDIVDFHSTHVHGKHLVCSHIRKGKNPSNPTDIILPKGTPNEAVVLDFLRRYVYNKDNVIYIATDSDDVRKQAEAQFDTYINVKRPFVHVDRIAKLKTSRTEACEGFHAVLVEQFILSQCDTLVLTRSNFGIMAAYIRGVSDNLFLYHHKTNNVLKSNLTDLQNVYKYL